MPVTSPAATAHVLANGEYAVMLTASGAGCSRWKDLAVTRWRADPTCDDRGSWIYLRDRRSGAVWSPTLQPCGHGNAVHEFDEVMARFARRDGDLVTTLEVAVDPEHPVEVRGVGLRNEGLAAREIELTSYLELVLGSAQADASHPAFSRMFVQTACEDGALLAWRRRRGPDEPEVWAAHALIVDGAERGRRQHETDRARFLGRDRTPRSPRVLAPGARLSGTTGTVLDPVFSLRTRVRVRRGETRRAAFVTAVAASRDEVIALIRHYRDADACAAVFARASERAPQALRAQGIDGQRARRYQRLAGALLYPDPVLRAAPEAIAAGEGGAPVLWAKGISGDLPIVLLRIDAAAQTGLVEDMLCAQRFWRGKLLPADLVIVNQAEPPQADALDVALKSLVEREGGQHDKARGSVFLLRADQLDERLDRGITAAARIVLHGRDGDPLARTLAASEPDGAGAGTCRLPDRTRNDRNFRPDGLPKLAFFNGLGGFSRDGREYVTVLRDGASTPAPWSHPVANPDFGFLVTATGGGYCWAVNSQQNAITPWSNDAVSDPPGEVFYLRDEDDGAWWSATASPIRVPGVTYVSRFGPGYARFETCIGDIESELLQCVAPHDPVKLSRLRLTNRSRRIRRIAVSHYVQWSLGAIGSDPAPVIVTAIDRRRGALFARNAWREEFTYATAFAACPAVGVSLTGDRTAFLGRHGSLEAPAVLASGEALNGAAGAGLDPCAAIRCVAELAPGASIDMTFLLGEAEDEARAKALVDRYRGADFDDILAKSASLWDGVLGALQVKTPEPSVDLLVNRCLPYQVLACRLWARTAFYQASGAFGFRDQLQDVMALCATRPDLARQHILLAASRQFEEGDVQHWWLPPSGKGVRTRIVDDRLWLPFVAAHYAETTGDAAILETQVPFLHGDALQPGQTDAFFAPAKAAAPATLYEHCARAIDASLVTGAHGLPLMGTGDWNDGMNRVGAGGKGESVWMGWFLIRVIADFAPHAEARRDPRAARWRDHARALQLALETKAWDGAWYRRAFYDDGTPLGSSAAPECRIDSIAQSWSVISGAGDPGRAAQAMRAIDELLVRAEDGVVALLTPPFDKAPRDPGYIKGYPPGLRENGGQYTHGSIWALIAFALLGDGDKAGQLLAIFDPVRKSATPERAARYKVEPYAACADVYSVAPHAGRGGWTWYTGSAGWLYRAIVEYMLGFRLHGDRLRIEPCIPRGWRHYSLEYRFRDAVYTIEVDNPRGVCRGVASFEVDGATLPDARAGIALSGDGARHRIRVVLRKGSG